MKPKAVNVLERYDLEVLRTWKVRGAILCESDKGLFIFWKSGPQAAEPLFKCRKLWYDESNKFQDPQTAEVQPRDNARGCPVKRALLCGSPRVSNGSLDPFEVC